MGVAGGSISVMRGEGAKRLLPGLFTRFGSKELNYLPCTAISWPQAVESVQGTKAVAMGTWESTRFPWANFLPPK